MKVFSPKWICSDGARSHHFLQQKASDAALTQTCRLRPTKHSQNHNCCTCALTCTLTCALRVTCLRQAQLAAAVMFHRLISFITKVKNSVFKVIIRQEVRRQEVGLLFPVWTAMFLNLQMCFNGNFTDVTVIANGPPPASDWSDHSTVSLVLTNRVRCQVGRSRCVCTLTASAASCPSNAGQELPSLITL